MGGEAYLVGRQEAGFLLESSKAKHVADKLFSAERLDSNLLENLTVCHCTFSNVSFKDAIVRSVKFENCAFINCYFKKTNVSSSDFDGCYFEDCLFPKTVFEAVNFRYPRFRNCVIDKKSLGHCLPKEPNLCIDLCRELRHASLACLDRRNYAYYHQQEIRATEEHLEAAAKQSSEYYKTHFPHFSDRTKAFFEWRLTVLARVLFGYGDRPWVLIRNLMILDLLVFLLIFVTGDGEAAKASAFDMALKATWAGIAPGIAQMPKGLSTIQSAAASGLIVTSIILYSVFATYWISWSKRA